MSVRNGLLAKIHIAKKDLGMDQATYRSTLQAVLGVDSAKEATDKQLAVLITHLRKSGWNDAPPKRENIPPQARGDCTALMSKIEAQLADAARPWSYAVALAKRLCKIDRLEWCDAEDLRKIIAALYYDAKRRAKGVPNA